MKHKKIFVLFTFVLALTGQAATPEELWQSFKELSQEAEADYAEFQKSEKSGDISRTLRIAQAFDTNYSQCKDIRDKLPKDKKDQATASMSRLNIIAATVGDFLRRHEPKPNHLEVGPTLGIPTGTFYGDINNPKPSDGFAYRNIGTDDKYWQASITLLFAPAVADFIIKSINVSQNTIQNDAQSCLKAMRGPIDIEMLLDIQAKFITSKPSSNIKVPIVLLSNQAKELAYQRLSVEASKLTPGKKIGR